MESLAILARFMYLTIVWFWLGTMVLRTDSQIAAAVSLWTLSAAIAGGSAIAQALWGYGIVPDGFTGPPFYGREAGITLHPNDLGSIASGALVPCFVLLVRSSPSWRLQVTYSVALLMLIGGLIVSGSVGGFVAALVGLVACVATFPAARRPLLLLLVVGGSAAWLALAPALSLPFASPSERILQVTANTSTASLQSRLFFDAETIDFMMRQPIIGVGLDGASQRRFLASPPEDMLLLAWLGGGLFSLLGLILILLACLREGVRKLRAARRPIPWDICAAVSISFTSTLVFSLASPVLQQRYAWMAAAIILAIRPPRAPGRWFARTIHRDQDTKGVLTRPIR